jgi:hypothetical protein
MNYKTIVYITLLPALLLGCQKTQEEKPSQNAGLIKGDGGAVINGAPWSADAIASLSRKDSNRVGIGLRVENEYGIVLNILSFSDIPLTEGKNVLIKNFAGFDSIPDVTFGFIEADLILKSYFLVEEDTLSYISLDSYDETTREISGQFSVKMSHFQAPTAAYPDTLYIRNGWYATTISY